MISPYDVFTPSGATVTVAVISGGSSGGPVGGVGNVLRFANVGATECFVSTSADNDPPADPATSFSVPGNTIAFLSVGPTALTVDAITAAGTTTLRITRGSLG